MLFKNVSAVIVRPPYDCYEATLVCYSRSFGAAVSDALHRGTSPHHKQRPEQRRLPFHKPSYFCGDSKETNKDGWLVKGICDGCIDTTRAGLEHSRLSAIITQFLDK